MPTEGFPQVGIVLGEDRGCHRRGFPLHFSYLLNERSASVSRGAIGRMRSRNTFPYKGFVDSGAGGRTRTVDLLFTKQLLYH